MNLGVFGGTFDPVHIGHLVLAESAREQFELDKVLWFPAGDPWRKRDQQVSVAIHRIEMVRRAIEGHQAFELRTDEVERTGPSYTVDTLTRVQAEAPGAALFLLLGEDALTDMPNWRAPEDIAKLATIAVAERPKTGAPEAIGPGAAGRIVRIDMPVIDVSSTGLRSHVTAGRSIRYLVPSEVAKYIQEHALYTAGT